MQVKPTVVVHLSGGLVQYAECDGYVNVVIVDHDLEGADEADLVTLEDGSRATVRAEPIIDINRKTGEGWLSLAAS